jgi:hypothetical protein
MFLLTKEEKRVVCFVLLAIMIGLGVKEYRRVQSPPKAAPSSLKQGSKGFPIHQIMPATGPTASPQPGDSQLKNDDPHK